MRIVYMGTPDFAVPALQRLAAAHEVAAVFTQPDKPVGRKQILTPPDVKVCARSLGIPVCQPTSMKTEEALSLLKGFAPEVIVVAAYGQILPKAVLELPRYGCVNIHGSLLPKYRGASPIQSAVLNGDRVTGVTTMLMDVGLDTGDILLTRQTEIGENETSEELFDRLSQLGGDLVIETLTALENGAVTPQKQDASQASYTSKIDKSLCPLDFSLPAARLHNQIRGLYSWPMATAQIGGKRVKIHRARVVNKSGKPGTILSVRPLVIACGDGAIEIVELQPEGKKKRTAEAFAAGHQLKAGETVGG